MKGVKYILKKEPFFTLKHCHMRTRSNILMCIMQMLMTEPWESLGKQKKGLNVNTSTRKQQIKVLNIAAEKNMVKAKVM